MKIYNIFIAVCFLSGGVFSQNQSQYDLPVATYGVISTNDICNAGDVTFSWSFCSLDSDGNTIPDWSFIDATFSMGDGGSIIYNDQSFAPINYTFSSFGSTDITGNARFKDEDGLIATVTIKNLFDQSLNGDPCYLEQNPLEPAANYLTVDVHNLNVEFDCDIQGNAVDFYNHSQRYPSGQGTSGWSYKLYLDGSLIDSGSGFPSSTTAFHSQTISQGQYMAELEFEYSQGLSCVRSYSKAITIIEEDTCTNCNTFKPKIGEKYWISAWVKEDVPSPVTTYTFAKLSVDFVGSGSPSVQFSATGEIIDGWQRIVGSFIIPSGTTDLDINLDNTGSSYQVFFDDVRIHPYNSSMKSYVYDPETLWLVAELDDNNFATFYEYDNEGKLIRIKKETSRGIMTIQESRSRTLKKP